MTLDDTKAKAEEFFEWPDPDRKPLTYITYTSAMLFAQSCVKDALAMPSPVPDRSTERCEWVKESPLVNEWVSPGCAGAGVSLSCMSWRYCPYCGKEIAVVPA